MNLSELDLYKTRAQVAKALAHPTRLQLLDLLQKQERCVRELTELVRVDQSTVSKHLAILKAAGLIVHRKAGNQQYYRVSCDCLGDFFRCLESLTCATPRRIPLEIH